MPELPEVETVLRGLYPFMHGRKFSNVTLRRENLRFAFADNFAGRLIGKEIINFSRRAKFLKAELSSGETLLMHLGMSGRFSVTNSKAALEKHDHVLFDMTGEGAPRIIYNDPRRFGFMELLAHGDAGRIADLGPEPLSNMCNGPSLHAALSGKKAPIKTALLDQKIIAGLGNIYVCEALHGAGVAPQRRSFTLSLSEAEILCGEIKQVLARAIEAGGSSLKDFASADGALGYFQHQFSVYGKKGEPCAKRDCKGEISAISQSGRSTFFCSQCQK